MENETANKGVANGCLGRPFLIDEIFAKTGMREQTVWIFGRIANTVTEGSARGNA
jgi:hypothetical protein